MLFRKTVGAALRRDIGHRWDSGVKPLLQFNSIKRSRFLISYPGNGYGLSLARMYLLFLEAIFFS